MGTGKTTLARIVLSKLGPDTHTAFILYPALTADELLHTILDDLHVKPQGESKKSLVDALHRFLLEARAATRNVVLLIDEAQDLSAEVLEQVRLISNRRDRHGEAHPDRPHGPVGAARHAGPPRAAPARPEVPATLDGTTLGGRRAGDEVNLETDVLAKYVRRALGADARGRSPWEQLGRAED